MTADRSLREMVARIVDPEAWEESFLPDGTPDRDDIRAIFADAIEESLDKADAILSELAASPSLGGQEDQGAAVADIARTGAPKPRPETNSLPVGRED